MNRECLCKDPMVQTIMRSLCCNNPLGLQIIKIKSTEFTDYNDLRP